MGFDVRQLQAPPPHWPALVGALRIEVDAVTDRVVDRVIALPTGRLVPVAELRPDVRACLMLLLSGMHHPPGNGRDPDAFRQTFARFGARRAAQGLSSADLLHCWRLMAEEVLAQARRVLPDEGASDAMRLRLAEELYAARDVAVLASAEGHRAVEADRSRRDNHYRSTLVRRLLTGSSTPEQLGGLLDRFEIDRSATYFAVRMRPVGGIGLTGIEDALLGARPRGGPGALALVDGDLCGFVRRLPTETLHLPVGVGGPVLLAELPGAFRRATRLLDAALALDRTGLVELGTLGVEAAVVADDEVGEAMLDRYVRPMTAQGAAGELILDTVARYVANDFRLDTTARELHVHVNTVRYRLGRFEQVTGSSLRSHDTLVEVWWALRRRTIRRSA